MAQRRVIASPPEERAKRCDLGSVQALFGDIAGRFASLGGLMKIRALATVALPAASLTACGEADEAPQDDAVSAEDIGDDGTYGDDEPEPETEPESDFARGDAVASSTEYLESVGVTDELVQQLAAVGQVNNYCLSVEKPMT
ncbi:hypothetical protein [Streptomyces sp. NPDC048560]|uniref:hypothetical protein n=1 Tax=Streptomyces sp. NPDC048560 TaxID=3155488 RepID=UPI0034445488